MPRIYRRLSLAVLFALVLTAAPAARPAYAQNIVVGNLTDVDDNVPDGCGASCSLREAIDLANERPGPNTITFSVTGEIVPLAPLPALTDDGTTIDAGTGHNVVLNGGSAGDANGITIRSSGNTIRGLVIYNFTGGDETAVGAGIYINGAPFGGQPARGDSNQLYGNWIGLNGAGSATISNVGYGIYLTNGASDNVIGADSDADRNVISGNYSGGIRLFNNITTAGFLSGNRIIGNYIGLDPTGEALPPGLNADGADSGVGVAGGSRNTAVSNNVIGGFNSGATGAIAAGINVAGSGNVVPLDGQSPTATTITGNYLGVTRGGVRVANRIGVRLGGGEYGPFDTTIGGPDEVDRNVIAGNGFRGIDLPDTGFIWGDATIAGNYIGLDGSGARQPNGWSSEAASGSGIFIGLPLGTPLIPVGKVTVGPGNVISANGTYGIWARTGDHVIRGNLFGTNAQGTSSSLTTFANGAANIFLENGTGVLVGGPSPADRNVLAPSDSTAGGGFGGGIMINPLPLAGSPNNCDGPCTSGGHTIEGNYIGVAVNGSSVLNTTRAQVLTKEGIRLRKTTGNVIRGNVIGGMNYGIVVGGIDAGTEADNTLIVGNKVGAPASGEIFFAASPSEPQLVGRAPRNIGDGIRVYRGTGNRITGNLLAYNASEFSVDTASAGIRVGFGNTAANGTVVEDNRLVRNGEFNTWGVVVGTADNVRLSRNTTQFNAGDAFTNRGGILLSLGGNNSRAAPTGLAIVAGSPPRLTGSAAACSGCTIEVFGSTLASEVNEGPVYLTAGQTDGSGGFNLPLEACQPYLTTTVTDGAGNTSAFSSQLNVGGACTPLSFSLGAATNPNRNLAPGATTTYTHTISNNSPISLTFTVVFTSSQRWASAPALVAVGPNSTASFAVSVRVPPGTSTTAPVPVDTTDVQVFAGLQGSNVVRDTTTTQELTIIPATPAISGPLTQPRTGPSLTFAHVVTNTGDVAGTFVLAGTPTLTGAPGDWSVGTVSPNSLTLGPQVTGTLSIQVNTPSLPPSTTPVTLTFRLNVQGSSPLRFATQSDVITLPLTRGFSFTPRASEVITTPAGAGVSFTYTLTNTGNATDTFSVTAGLAGGSIPGVAASSPSLTNLAPGASSAVTVTYNVPSGTLQGSYATTITATAAPGTSPPDDQVRNVTINVTGGGAAVITPGLPSIDPVSPAPGGTLVTFTNTLSNTGNAASRVQLNPVTGVPTTPAGWLAEITNVDCPTGSATLAAGAACTFIVAATVPEGAPGGPVPLGISATAFNTPPDIPDVTATAVNTVTVTVVRSFQLAPDGLAATSGPGEVVTFTHTLTNTGNAADSFDLAVAQSPGGWTVNLSPTLISNLPVGVPRAIEVTAQAGPGVSGGATNTITLTATGLDGGPSQSVSDSVTLASINGGDLLGFGRSNVDPGGTAVYSYTVVNTGTVPLSYTLSLTNSLEAAGWSAAAGGAPTAVVAPGLTTTLTVNVTAPLSAAPGLTNTTTIRLLAGDGTGPTLDTATAVTGIGPRLGVLLVPESRIGEGRANTTVALTHTLTNLGSEQGTFQITTTEILGWGVEAAPDVVTLGPGESVAVIVRVTVKPSAEAGARNFIKVRAELLGEPSVSDESIDQVTVPLVVGLSLSSSQLRGVPPGTTTSLDSLTVFNSGSAYDFFTLTISGESADWDVILGQSIVGVNTGDPARVSVQIKVGAGVVPGTTRTIRIEARSSSDGTVRSSVTLSLTALGRPPAAETIYLPLVKR